MIIRAHHKNSDLVGLYYLLNSNIFIYPYSTKLELDEYNKVELTAYGSDMIGLYYILKEDVFIYPKNLLDREIEIIRNSLNREGLETFQLSTHRNALSNNIHIGDRVVLVNPRMEKGVKRELSDITGKEVIEISLGNYSTVGSLIYENRYGFVLGYRAGEDNLERLEELLGKQGYVGSLNSGFGFVRLCVVGNSKINIIGKSTTGIEEMRFREYLLPNN
ncbi:MAG: hypothetical protein QXV16_02235 [Candidatus Anstonellales archaeon]